MGQALYRKYRSKSLSEIVGQEHIITTLKNALKKGSISHAYLFTGPRGVGKTSIARILAHEINDLDYNSPTPHIDIIEIDAASNRRIDEIRDLRDKVHIAPTSAKYKVYIIDEVHMLTKEAFNALLKTLEEPPAHVIFILATTESHKLPDTIISRTQHFTFKPIDPAKAVEHLRSIAKQEKLEISDDALELISQHGDGSFRDSISLLDQISSLGRKIEADDVRESLGLAPKTIIDELYKNVVEESPKSILDTLQMSSQRGYEATQIAKQLSQQARLHLLTGQGSAEVNTTIMEKLIEIPASSNPSTKLEVTLIGINLANHPSQSPPSQPKIAEAAVKPAPKAVVMEPAPKPVPAAAPLGKPAKVEITEDLKTAWSNVLTEVKKKYNTLYGVLRMADPVLVDNEVTLTFQFPFHLKRLNETKNREIVVEQFSAQMGRPIAVKCRLVEKAKKTAPSPSTPPTGQSSSPLDTISNIFGPAEVLES